jgi:N-acetylglucosaminyldiphosphoundecaprenol N-acetyl-beta-D-mannosaminyltransferase
MVQVSGPDPMPAVCARAAKRGWSASFYVGKAGIAEQVVSSVKRCFRGLHVVGVGSPPFRLMTRREDDDVIERINAVDPDPVGVGLNTPKHERWMGAHRSRLNASVLIGVGAPFDIHAGVARQAPRWMQRPRLEWFFRMLEWFFCMLVEPRHLTARYLRNNPAFVRAIVSHHPSLLAGESA